MLETGISRVSINPPLILPHAGWGAQSHVFAEGYDTPLFSTVLLISNGNSLSVLVDLDLCVLLVPDATLIRQRIADALDIEPSQVRVCTTHTHAGPLTRTVYYKNGERVRQTYMKSLIDQTIGAALQARNNKVPVTVGAGYGHCTVAKNRRQKLENGRMVVGVNVEGYIDPTVSVIRFENEKGKTIASIVHYSMHPTTLGPANKFMSADYPGIVKQVVEGIVGGTCIFLQGATGNIGPGVEGFKDNYPAVQRMGTILGCEAAKVLLSTPTKEVIDSFEGVIESGASLGMWKRENGAPLDDTFKVLTKEINLPLKPQLPTEEARRIALEYQEKLQKLQEENGTEEEIKEITYKVKRSYLALNRSELYFGKSHEKIEAHYIRVGDIVLIGVPFEPFAETGAAIRQKSPFTYTLFSGYSNGQVGYLPTGEAFDQGGYEVENSPFAKSAAERLVEEILSTLEELRK